jgi:hypothetical protein
LSGSRCQQDFEAQIQKDSYYAGMATKQPTAYPLRMPDDLRDKIESVAQEAGRSVNQEIVQRLSDSFEAGKSLPKTVTEVVEKAAELAGQPFDDALLRFVVVGMQAEPLRKSAEEALHAERYKGEATRHLMNRAADLLHQMGEAVTSVEFTPELRGDWKQTFTMLVHEIRRMDRL